jgi:hypothetical protein
MLMGISSIIIIQDLQINEFMLRMLVLRGRLNSVLTYHQGSSKDVLYFDSR